MPEIPTLLGIASICALFVSTATIDTGKMDKDLHVHCAGIFFIGTIATTLYNTVIVYFAYKGTKSYKVIDQHSTFAKLVIAVAIVYQVVLSVEKGDVLFLQRDNSDLSHILEYTFTFSLLGYMLTMAYDLKDFSFGYTLVK